MRKTLILSACGALAAFSAPSHAQIPPPPNVEPPKSDSFVATWEKVQADRATAFERAGQTPTANALRAQVRNYLRRTAVPDYAAINKERVPDLRIEEVVQVLTMVGVSPSAISGPRAEAEQIIAAAERVATARGTFDDQVLLSPIVLVARPVELTPDPSVGDGFNATVTLAPEKVVKGADLPEQIRVRQSLRLDGPAKDVLETGARFLIFLSPAQYRYRAARSRGTAQPTYVSDVFTPYRVDGDQLVAIGEGQPQPTKTVSQLVQQ